MKYFILSQLACVYKPTKQEAKSTWLLHMSRLDEHDVCLLAVLSSTLLHMECITDFMHEATEDEFFHLTVLSSALLSPALLYI